jgi:carbon storage regulator CsrA
MLVLSRKIGDEILIGDNIRLVVNRISGNRVTIGIKAPDDVHIVRGELSHFSRPTKEPVSREKFTAATTAG